MNSSHSNVDDHSMIRSSLFTADNLPLYQQQLYDLYHKQYPHEFSTDTPTTITTTPTLQNPDNFTKTPPQIPFLFDIISQFSQIHTKWVETNQYNDDTFSMADLHPEPLPKPLLLPLLNHHITAYVAALITNEIKNDETSDPLPIFRPKNVNETILQHILHHPRFAYPVLLQFITTLLTLGPVASFTDDDNSQTHIVMGNIIDLLLSSPHYFSDMPQCISQITSSWIYQPYTVLLELSQKDEHRVISSPFELSAQQNIIFQQYRNPLVFITTYPFRSKHTHVLVNIFSSTPFHQHDIPTFITALYNICLPPRHHSDVLPTLCIQSDHAFETITPNGNQKSSDTVLFADYMENYTNHLQLNYYDIVKYLTHVLMSLFYVNPQFRYLKVSVFDTQGTDFFHMTDDDDDDEKYDENSYSGTTRSYKSRVKSLLHPNKTPTDDHKKTKKNRKSSKKPSHLSDEEETGRPLDSSTEGSIEFLIESSINDDALSNREENNDDDDARDFTSDPFTSSPSQTRSAENNEKKKTEKSSKKKRCHSEEVLPLLGKSILHKHWNGKGNFYTNTLSSSFITVLHNAIYILLRHPQSMILFGENHSNLEIFCPNTTSIKLLFCENILTSKNDNINNHNNHLVKMYDKVDALRFLISIIIDQETTYPPPLLMQLRTLIQQNYNMFKLLSVCLLDSSVFQSFSAHEYFEVTQSFKSSSKNTLTQSTTFKSLKNARKTKKLKNTNLVTTLKQLSDDLYQASKDNKNQSMINCLLHNPGSFLMSLSQSAQSDHSLNSLQSSSYFLKLHQFERNHPQLTPQHHFYIKLFSSSTTYLDQTKLQTLVCSLLCEKPPKIDDNDNICLHDKIHPKSHTTMSPQHSRPPPDSYQHDQFPIHFDILYDLMQLALIYGLTPNSQFIRGLILSTSTILFQRSPPKTTLSSSSPRISIPRLDISTCFSLLRLFRPCLEHDWTSPHKSATKANCISSVLSSAGSMTDTSGHPSCRTAPALVGWLLGAMIEGHSRHILSRDYRHEAFDQFFWHYRGVYNDIDHAMESGTHGDDDPFIYESSSSLARVHLISEANHVGLFTAIHSNSAVLPIDLHALEVSRSIDLHVHPLTRELMKNKQSSKTITHFIESKQKSYYTLTDVTIIPRSMIPFISGVPYQNGVNAIYIPIHAVARKQHHSPNFKISLLKPLLILALIYSYAQVPPEIVPPHAAPISIKGFKNATHSPLHQFFFQEHLLTMGVINASMNHNLAQSLINSPPTPPNVYTITKMKGNSSSSPSSTSIAMKPYLTAFQSAFCIKNAHFSPKVVQLLYNQNGDIDIPIHHHFTGNSNQSTPFLSSAIYAFSPHHPTSTSITSARKSPVNPLLAGICQVTRPLDSDFYDDFDETLEYFEFAEKSQNTRNPKISYLIRKLDEHHKTPSIHPSETLHAFDRAFTAVLALPQVAANLEAVDRDGFSPLQRVLLSALNLNNSYTTRTLGRYDQNYDKNQDLDGKDRISVVDELVEDLFAVQVDQNTTKLVKILMEHGLSPYSVLSDNKPRLLLNFLLKQTTSSNHEFFELFIMMTRGNHNESNDRNDSHLGYRNNKNFHSDHLLFDIRDGTQYTFDLLFDPTGTRHVYLPLFEWIIKSTNIKNIFRCTNNALSHPFLFSNNNSSRISGNLTVNNNNLKTIFHNFSSPQNSGSHTLLPFHHDFDAVSGKYSLKNCKSESVDVISDITPDIPYFPVSLSFYHEQTRQKESINPSVKSDHTSSYILHFICECLVEKLLAEL